MLKIEVTGSYIKHVTGSKGANAGKQFDIPMVRAFAWLPGERYPTKCVGAQRKLTQGAQRKVTHL